MESRFSLRQQNPVYGVRERVWLESNYSVYKKIILHAHDIFLMITR